jgi:hypothetical protein
MVRVAGKRGATAADGKKRQAKQRCEEKGSVRAGHTFEGMRRKEITQGWGVHARTKPILEEKDAHRSESRPLQSVSCRGNGNNSSGVTVYYV